LAVEENPASGDFWVVLLEHDGKRWWVEQRYQFLSVGEASEWVRGVLKQNPDFGFVLAERIPGLPNRILRTWNVPQETAKRIVTIAKAESVNPAGPTIHQAMLMARAAGARIGDTSGFEPWLKKAKLEGRSPMLRKKLEAEFWEGVEQGEFPASSSEEREYHGARIWKTAEGWKTSVDPDSAFDNIRQVQRFVDAQRNPSVGAIRAQYLKLIERYAYAHESRKLARMNATHEALEQFETKYNLDPNSRRDAISYLKRTHAGLSLQHALDSVNDFYRNPDAPDTPRFVPAEDDWPVGPIKWTVIDTQTGHKVPQSAIDSPTGVKTHSGGMWIRTRTREAAERIADKLNRQERKRRVA
jgi:hypothetical protein